MRNTKRMQNRKVILRMVSLLLVTAMLYDMQGMSAFATTVGQVSENNAEETEEDTNTTGTVADGADAGANAEASNSIEDSDNNKISLNANDLTIIDDTVAAGTPANPVHHCTKQNDGTDTTTWSYVYFGSYPQSEVTDDATKSAIDSAIASEGKTSSGEGIDVWVGSTKYRRISKSDCNYTGYFNYVDNNGYRYFKWERIKWRVLNNDGSTLFAIADKGIDCKCYHDTYTGVTWETSDIRSWLNGTFYQNAFSSGEQGAIVPKTIVNADNPDYGTAGGNNTTDRVFLLSLDEINNDSYGFCSSYDVYSASRWRQPSAYARARGSYIWNDSTYTGGNDNCWWWLRSPGSYGIDALSVTYNGFVDSHGGTVNVSNVAVVPALHINLSSDLWSLTDDGTSGSGGGGGETPESKEPYRGNYTFGNWNNWNAETLYDDVWFQKSSYSYNHDLALFAAALSSEMYKKGGYKNSAEDNKKREAGKKDIINAYKKIGYDICSIYDGKADGSVSTSSIALKKVLVGEEAANIVLVAVEGTADMEWIDDFRPGEIGNGSSNIYTHKGFLTAADYVYNSLGNFISAHKRELSDDPIKILVTGHSRGAAVANLLGKRIQDEGIVAGKTSMQIPAENIFTYTFASPNPTTDNNCSAAKYNNIFNIVNPEDFVTKVMPSKWGFKRYGITYVLPCKQSEPKAAYSRYLKSAKKIYPDYQPYSGGMKPVSDYVKFITDNVPTYDQFYSKNLTPKRKTESLKLKGTNLQSLYEFSLGGIMCGDSTRLNVALATIIDIKLGGVYGKVGNKTINYFVAHQALGMLEPELKKIISIDSYIVMPKGFLSNCMLNLKNVNLVSKEFENAHASECYFALMKAVNQKYMTEQRNYKVTTDAEGNVTITGKSTKAYYGIVNCPVDVTITDENGTVVGRITDNAVDETFSDSDVSMSVDGDSKTFMLPSCENYDVRLTGNDNGSMDYSLCEIDADTGEVSRIVYADVPVKKNVSMSQALVSENSIGELVLKDENEDEIQKSYAFDTDDLGDIDINVSVDGIGSAQSFIGLTVGDYVTLNAVTDNNNSFLGWYEDDMLVCEDDEYAFTAKESRDLTAKFTDVFVELEKIDFQQKEIKMSVGDVDMYPAFATPKNATEQSFNYESSDEAVAEVYLDGIIEAKKPGEAMITATSADGSKTATFKVVVTDVSQATSFENSNAQNSAVKVASIAITGISKKIAAGKSVQLTADVSPANASDKTVTWTSSNTKFATVNASGKVFVKKAGAGKSITITAKANDGSGVTAAYKITIMKDAVKSIKLSAANKTVKEGKSVKVKATIKTTGKKVNKALKWTSSNTDYATVNKNGKVTTKKAGKGKTVTITAQATDGSGKKAKIKIKIK